jgi:TetR/AcrR family transcriptional regulator
VKSTNQLVIRRRRAARRPTGPPAPRGRRHAPRRPDRAEAAGSRARLFAAAADEFAARGFAGANVDRIAATAGLNKAMIYYHFRSKAALYREILRDMFEAVAARVETVAASSSPPDEKMRLFANAIATEAEARPYFPSIWLREIAEKGSHVDASILRVLTRVLAALTAIIDEGVRQRRFRPVNPLLIHAGIVAPLLLFFAIEPLRQRIGRTVTGAALVNRADMVAHVQRIALGVLEGRM